MSLAKKIIDNRVMEQYDRNNGANRPEPGCKTYVPDNSGVIMSVSPIDAPSGSVARVLLGGELNGTQYDGCFTGNSFMFTEKSNDRIRYVDREEIAIIAMLTLDYTLKNSEPGQGFADRMHNGLWCLHCSGKAVTLVLRDGDRVVEASDGDMKTINLEDYAIIGKYVPIITDKY